MLVGTEMTHSPPLLVSLTPVEEGAVEQAAITVLKEAAVPAVPASCVSVRACSFLSWLVRG